MSGSRVLGVDVGARRVGLAVSDDRRRVATPLDTLDLGAAEGRAWLTRLVKGVSEAATRASCDLIVVGLPRSLSGHDTASTRMARQVADALQGSGRTVELWDERFSSVEADRRMVEAGVGGRDRRQGRDRVAATLILQGWLDARGS